MMVGSGLNRLYDMMNTLVDDATAEMFWAWEAEQPEARIAGTCGDAGNCVLTNFFTDTAPPELKALLDNGDVVVAIEPVRASVLFARDDGAYYFTMDRDVANIGRSFDDYQVEHPGAVRPTFGELRSWLQWSSAAD